MERILLTRPVPVADGVNHSLSKSMKKALDTHLVTVYLTVCLNIWKPVSATYEKKFFFGRS